MKINLYFIRKKPFINESEIPLNYNNTWIKIAIYASICLSAWFVGDMEVASNKNVLVNGMTDK